MGFYGSIQLVFENSWLKTDFKRGRNCLGDLTAVCLVIQSCEEG